MTFGLMLKSHSSRALHFLQPQPMPRVYFLPVWRHVANLPKIDFMPIAPSQTALPSPLLFRNSPRSALPHNEFLPFAHFATASRAVVKRLSLFGVEVRRAAALVTTALKPQPSPPDRQISPFAESPPKAYCSFVPARQTPFAGWLTRFYQPSNIFAAGL
jgi:hypothetical protein